MKRSARARGQDMPLASFLHRMSQCGASAESETGRILTSLRQASMMLFTGRTHFFRDNAPRKIRGFS
jgi:hypothetical protein